MRSFLALLFVALACVPAIAQNDVDPSCPCPRCAVEDPLDQAARMCADEPSCAPPRSPWYARADFIMLRRDVKGVPVAMRDILLTDSVYPETIALTTNSLEEPFRPGASLMIGRTLGDTPYQIEFSYFQVNDWNDSISVRDSTENVLGTSGNLFSPFTNFANPNALYGFDYNNFVSIRESSDLYNVEMNVRHLLPIVTRSMAVSWLVGVRHIGIGEQFDYLSESVEPTAQGSSLGLQTRTRNSLWGAQIGGRLEFYAQNNCWINFEIKGALCANSTRQQTAGTLLTGGASTAIDQERSDNITSYVGDISLELVYRPTRHLATRFGYQALWVDSLTLAAQNFSPPSDILLLGPPQINTSGNAVYHGPHIGMELSW